MSRTGVATILTLLGCLLAGPALAAYSLDDQIADQNNYVQAVTPIADNPAVRQEAANRATASLIPDKLPLPESATRLVHSAVTKVVDSEGFRTGWVAANRTAQPEVVKVLRGEPSTLRIVDDTVLLDLGAVVEQFKARLAEDGVPFARQLPDIDASIRLFSRPAIRQAIPAFTVLESTSVVLPIIAVALLVLGLAISARRRLTLITTGVGLAGSMLIVVVYQAITRGQLVSRSRSPEMAGAFYDAITANLTTLLWVVFGIGLAAAAIGLILTGRRGRQALTR